MEVSINPCAQLSFNILSYTQNVQYIKNLIIDGDPLTTFVTMANSATWSIFLKAHYLSDKNFFLLKLPSVSRIIANFCLLTFVKVK